MVVHPLDHARIRKLPRPSWPDLRARLAGVASLIGARVRASARPVRARAGYAGGVAVGSWGVGVQFGLGWALMVGGLVAAASFLLLYPVEGP
jgi:hypothetical protein